MMAVMQRPGVWWSRLPTAIRLALSVVIFVPFYLIVFSLVIGLADSIAPDGDAGSGLKALMLGLLGVALFLVYLRSLNRKHGGADRRRAFQSAIRTGVIAPDADRDRLQEAVDRFYAARKALLVIFVIGIGLLALPIVLVALDPPYDAGDLTYFLSQSPLLVLFAVPTVLLWRRWNRQMTALRDALQTGVTPPSTDSS